MGIKGLFQLDGSSLPQIYPAVPLIVDIKWVIFTHKNTSALSKLVPTADILMESYKICQILGYGIDFSKRKH